MDSVFWLIVLAIMLVLEIITLGLTTIWFAGGALVTFFLSLAISNTYVEWMVFLLISILCLAALRPLFIDKFNAKREKTNVDSVAGQSGRVVTKIDNMNASGTVSLKGQEWTARTENDDEIIEVGEKVVVVKVTGVKLIVKKES